MRALLPTVALLLLAGCVTPEQHAQRDAAVCAGQATRTGAPDMVECLADIDRRRLAGEAAEQRRAQGVAGLTIGSLIF